MWIWRKIPFTYVSTSRDLSLGSPSCRLFPLAKRAAYGTGRRYIFGLALSWLRRPPRVTRVREDAFAPRGWGRKDNSTSSARSLSPSNSQKIDRSQRSYKTIPRGLRDGGASRFSSGLLTWNWYHESSSAKIQICPRKFRFFKLSHSICYIFNRQ